MSRAKKSTPSSRFLGFLIVRCVFVIVFALLISGGIIYLRHQTSLAANELKDVEFKIAEQRRKVSELNVALARHESRQHLIRLNRKMKLGMSEPGYEQIVRVTEDVEARLLSKASNETYTALAYPRN